MRPRTLLTQVLAVNTLLVAGTAFVAAVVARNHLGDATSGDGLLLIWLAVFIAVLLNSLLLRRRLAPIERLAETMSRVDLSSPGMRAACPPRAAREVQRLTADFNRMLERLEEERRESGRAVLRAQEAERSRIAQDLHDEVNQALTGLLLRIEAMRRKAPAELVDELAETSAVAGRAMEELLTLARQLRPTTLDDLGLEAALAALTHEVGRRSGIATAFESEGDFTDLAAETQLVTYRIAQEALSNAIQHADARHVRVRLLRLGDELELRVSDDGRGFDLEQQQAGLGMAGMRERALLVGARLAIDSAPDSGTRVRLRA